MDIHNSSHGLSERHTEGDPAEGISIDQDTLGQYLRKIRISSRIEVHKMAADTRLSAEYIAAIEKDEFNKIPGQTYQKIFIKSVAKYLGLNPDDIYSRFVRQQGSTAGPECEPEEKPVKKETREIEKAEIAQHQKPMRHLAIIISLLLLVFLLLILAQKEKQMPAAESLTDSLAADTASLSEPEPSAAPVITPESGAQAENNALEPAPEPEEPLAQEPKDEVLAQQNRFRNEKQGSIKVTIACTDDSSYINAWRNKTIWFNIFRKGDRKTFASDNPLYFWIRHSGKVTLSTNNTLASFDPAKGRYVKIDANGLAYITQAEWEELSGVKQ
ncbi:MAG: hypothetical protein A2268_03200 [Candidatus Raymondbacteria bacterium RifOxyA12_full_50_37]|uniref:HTH cro/C1-type domain-containing protein n=1 Tax=Candidatus Raymondbacteria bacterium RIFOXYD12_FULL_49_13 TaxID=1817890 RepID=A0A1F7F852_UNCRA|nr:MAG: hypothetical protein A2268_03200 [Candidatus Raymondbacteria bacterium RifOxyA12_full_50_37]OGJ86746.1 MAG: hypothetical protein A2248_09930 [Candidatus Raymondbacteria bacterium RIFOXYA2_FULL_49_16]OGK01551.1 MAG: hypothetical protein A2350_06470 [Candidatus Raymondbacteria bacterium RifOxyB12_full_50_8]OGK02839.1 MAG: hypothetical protein A2519_06640 [Candidatus Raymondbacteria bacterium RIFOXYD12_FULL_49_13]OGK03575.1 MAG: hypothetical protein A2487_05065 [Candidatus Raymondbacteria 